MLRIFSNKLTKVGTAIMAVLASASLSSCDSVIYSDLPPCDSGVQLRFVYDYNMEFANAFPGKVDCLTVLVYDQDGKCIQRHYEAGEKLKDEDYRLTLDLPQGQYVIDAYGGMECDDASFVFEAQPEQLSRHERKVKLNTLDADNRSNQLLHPHFHGSVQVSLPEPDEMGYRTATVEMMKNTNNFRLVLQHVSGKPVDSSKFDFEITDDNVRFNHDNSLSPTQEVTYQHWTKGDMPVGVNPDGTDCVVAYGELSTSRLTHRASRAVQGTGIGESSVDEPKLRIYNNETGEPVIDIPLINYLLLFKSDVYAKMPNQEFLDRESEWRIIFFLTDKEEWLRTQIVVNDWVVRINDIEE